MADKKLSTDSYKGVRDFFPEDMAIQRYIFDTWGHTAESFGYERYDASVLEPAALYKSKGAENEELVNEQTYTFTDRGNREVTLRPEMTPTVARMVAAKRRDLSFPVRWYSIPNLFRYERMQRGRLREHWQFNCDLFGADDYTADVEMIFLAHQTLINFGADPEMFEIRINDRRIFPEIVQYFAKEHGSRVSNEKVSKMVRLMDKMEKMSSEKFNLLFEEILGEDLSDYLLDAMGKKQDEFGEKSLETAAYKDLERIVKGLNNLGVTNVKFDSKIMRGFDYYTGTIFEIFDTSKENNRSLIGGGRYDNLTGLFGGEPVSGVGFGMGDVTMRNFLETHDLLTSPITSPTLMILPTEGTLNLEAEKLAQQFRAENISVSVDLSTKKIGKKIAAADKALVSAVIILGEDEVKNENYTMKNLPEGTEETGTVEELIGKIIT